MMALCIQLHPERLENPDLDIRYVLADKVCQLAEDSTEVISDGYDFGEDDSCLNVYFNVSDIDLLWPKLKEYLETNEVLGNKILRGAIITYDGEQGGSSLLSHFDSDA